jgi:TolB-like protein
MQSPQIIDMNPLRTIVVALCIFMCGHTTAKAQDMDTELSNLTDKLATQISDHGKKKVSVIDFADLQGHSSELGKYIAEQLTVDMVMGKHDFSVLDRANLKSILAEHKLTAEGLVDPENAKQLGKFAGVDAIVLGTIIPKGQDISLTAKIITTDTAEIVGAARAEFKTNDTVQQFISTPAAGNQGGASLADDAAQVVKKYGDLSVGLQTLHIVNGGQFQLTMTLANQNPKKSVWVALNNGGGFTPNGGLTDANGFQFAIDRTGLSGIESASYGPYGYDHNSFSPALEIKPNDSVSATVKFMPHDGRTRATPGICNLQIEFLLGQDFGTAAATVKVNNLVSKIEAK